MKKLRLEYCEYEALVGELKQWGMGQILDIVPNHMCIEGQGNAYWMDVPMTMTANPDIIVPA